MWLSPVSTEAVRATIGVEAGRGGGWIDGLRRAVAGFDEIELGIASAGPLDYAPFSDAGVTYFALHDRGRASRVSRALARATFSDRIVDYSRQVDEVIERFRPDLIHVHGTETSLGLVVERTAIPVLVSMQGIASDIVNHYFDALTATDVVADSLRLSRTLRGVGFVPGYLALRRAVPTERRVLRRARYFTGRTEYDRDAVLQANSEATYFHCDRVLRAEFYETPPAPAGPRAGLLCVAGGAPYKGVELVIQALASEGTLSRTTLRVAGAIEGHSIQRVLVGHATRLGVLDRVEWLGGLGAAQLRDELLRCAVCVVPSHVDNSPNSLAEAMLTGAPCVGSTAGGIPSMVEHGSDGLLFESGDVAALTQALERVIGDPELASRLGANARARAAARHAPTTIGEATLSAYRAIRDAEATRRT